MFQSVNSRFFTIAGLLALIFIIFYSMMVYFHREQGHSAIVMQEAVFIEREINSLHDKFHNVRFWERTILLKERPEADKNFGELLEQVRESLQELYNKEPAFFIKKEISSILTKLTQYEEDFNKIIQYKTVQRMHRTRMDTSYQSLASYVLGSNKPDLLKPLFTLTRFQNNYRTDRRESEYLALKLVADSLEKKLLKKIPVLDDRAVGYLKSFVGLLNKDFALEGEIRSINVRFDATTVKLTELFTDTLQKSKKLLGEEFLKVEKNRERLNRLSLIFSFISLITLLLVLLLISKKIITPIRSVADVMRKVKAGDLDARFTYPGDRNDEIVQFGLSFNDMLDTLETYNQKLVEYQNELEIKVADIEARSVELTRINEELEKEIGERKKAESEGQRLASQLQRVEKMEALGTLAGGVAHDLNNILSGIVSYPELLLLDLPEDHPLRKPLKTIHESGLRAANIVQDLLTLARRGVAVTSVVNINNVCSEYLGSLEHEKLELVHPLVQVKTDMEPKLLNIVGSPVHLGKTVMNLVSNAAESMPDGGIISIKTENRYIDRPIQGYDSIKEGDYVVLCVSDSGIGISAEDLARIFEPFYTKKIMGRSGTGLGMAVVWGTVKDHKGYIDIQSVEGKGTMVSIYFPATREELTKESLQLGVDHYMGNGESILIVDDVKEQREIASKMLEKLGYSVATRSSGEEAVEYLKVNAAALIILDMIMDPGIDGLETYRQILEINPGQKAIIASGYSETERVREAQKIGAGEYIKKPYTLEKIGLALMRELNK